MAVAGVVCGRLGSFMLMRVIVLFVIVLFVNLPV